MVSRGIKYALVVGLLATMFFIAFARYNDPTPVKVAEPSTATVPIQQTVKPDVVQPIPQDGSTLLDQTIERKPRVAADPRMESNESNVVAPETEQAISFLFEPALIDDPTRQKISAGLKITANNIHPVAMKFDDLEEIQLYDVIRFAIPGGEEIEVYITEINRTDEISYIKGHLSNMDPGYYFGITYDATGNVYGSFTSMETNFLISTILGYTVVTDVALMELPPAD